MMVSMINLSWMSQLLIQKNNNSRKENNTGVKSKETKGTCDAFIMVDDQICQVKESTCP